MYSLYLFSSFVFICNYEKKAKTVMVNNSTNINTIKNYILPKIIEHLMLLFLQWGQVLVKDLQSVNWIFY